MRWFRLLCLCALQSAALPLLRAQSAPATTVILVRHGEKAAEPAADPPLTADGVRRATALLDALRDAGVTRIITSQYLRTRTTAEPLATASRVTPETISAAGTTHPADVAAAIKARPGGTIVYVGHSNTIAQVITALGGPTIATICDSTHDNLFVLRLAPDTKPSLVTAKYGERSPATGPNCATMK
jgi:broad specificity phosphatase PhoE